MSQHPYIQKSDFLTKTLVCLSNGSTHYVLVFNKENMLVGVNCCGPSALCEPPYYGEIVMNVSACGV